MGRVKILGTGGTIASRSGGGSTGAVATDGVELLATGLGGGHEVSAADILRTGSYRLSLADLRLIAERVCSELAAADVDGIVLTHGTDTLEETAFLLDLVHDSPKPVVLTGAQRSADSAVPDGPRNLQEAVEAAASAALRGSGVLVSFSGSVRSARGAHKAHTTAPNAFGGGVEVAHFAEDELVPQAVPIRRPALPLPGPRFDRVRVEILECTVGSGTQMLEYAVDSGADAVVLAGTGVGNAGPGVAECVRRAVDGGCPVILSTRVQEGAVVPLYGNGGGVDLVQAGAVPSGRLKPAQARILAALLLSHEPAGNVQFAASFARYR